MNIDWEQLQWFSLCVILTATIGMDSGGDIFVLDVIKNLSIIDSADDRTVIKEYPTDGNLNF